jgi:hypothetical protein
VKQRSIRDVKPPYDEYYMRTPRYRQLIGMPAENDPHTSIEGSKEGFQIAPG